MGRTRAPRSRAANGATAWRVTGPNAYGDATTTQIQPDRTQAPSGVGRLMFFTTPV